MPGVMPEPNGGVPDGVLPAVHVIRSAAEELNRLGRDFRPYAQQAKTDAEAVEFASDSEIARDLAAAARRYTADARRVARDALAVARAVEEKHDELVPMAAADARTLQNDLLKSPYAQALPTELAARFAAAETEGFAGGNAHLQLALKLRDQYVREGDQAALRALRIAARPLLVQIGPDAGDDAFRARAVLRDFAADEQRERGDVPRREAEAQAVRNARLALENEFGKLVKRLNDVFPEDPTVWDSATLAEPDHRRAMDAVPALYRHADGSWRARR